ncbi:SufBD protein [Dielma fastidiosa]|uniref:SufBD protein n=1 Tax=Dielma fastidiosa TaxID=1034346 RepID=UPI0035682718
MAVIYSEEEIRQLIAQLYASDANAGYAALKQLEMMSEEGAAVSLYLDEFFSMLNHKNSYVRNRGLVLIAANAKWDSAQVIDAQLEHFLDHLHDEKPITARQCVKLLPLLVKDKPELALKITAALRQAQPMAYSANMQKLIAEDIKQSLALIENAAQR